MTAFIRIRPSQHIGIINRSQFIQLSATIRCPIDNEIVKEDVICLSPDKQHDAKAVKEFLQATYNHL